MTAVTSYAQTGWIFQKNINQGVGNAGESGEKPVVEPATVPVQ